MFFIIWFVFIGSCFSFGSETPASEPSDVNSKWKRALILDGVEARPNEFPWLVFLCSFYIWIEGPNRPIAKDGNGKTEIIESYCGGSILNSHHILSAKHCVEVEMKDKDEQKVEKWYRLLKTSIGVGFHRLDSPLAYLDQIKIKEGETDNKAFTRHPEDDLVIIKTDEDLLHQNFGSNAKSIKVGTEPCRSDHDSWVAGWGSTFIGGGKSDVLKKARVTCKTTLLHELDVVAKDDDPSSGLSSHGDSGGPLMVRDKYSGQMFITGVLSHGNKHVSFFVDVTVDCIPCWIEQNSRE